MRTERVVAVLLLVVAVCVSDVLSGRKLRENTPEKEGGATNGKKSRHRNRGYRNGGRDGVCELEINCRGEMDDEGVEIPGTVGSLTGGGGEVTTVPVKLPIRGPRGPPGTDGGKGERGDDGLPGLPGLPGLSAPTPKKIAFFVGLSDNMGPVKEHKDIVFDRVITNIGAAYNENTGRFKAPINGTFQFNVIVSAQGRQKTNARFGGGKAAVMILKNGGMVATVWAESIPYWATASNIAVLSLEKGDEVWLMLLNRASYLHGYMYSTFSGFMIFEN